MYEYDYVRIRICIPTNTFLGCQELNEPGPRSFSREDLLDFDHVRYYDKLCDKFPTLMTCLVAATSNSLSWEEALQAGQIYRTLAGAC